MRYLRLANEDQTTVIDLLRDTTIRLAGGFDFMTPGQGGTYTYEPYGAQFAFGNFQPQTEVFDLVLKGSTAAIIAASNRLQDFLEAARLFHAGDLAAKSCWLEWSADGESPKRSLLYSGTFKVISQDNVTPGLEECKVKGTLSLSRHPLWDNYSYTTLTLRGDGVGGSIPTVGGQVAIANIPGNTLARLWRFQVAADGAAGPLAQHWIGIRRENRGITNFESVWECEDGTAGTDCGAAVLDATASPEHLAPGTGAKRTVTYVTTTLASRLTITVGQVCAAAGHSDYVHQWGRYLVLLRCKLTAAGTSGIQMRSGYTGNIRADEVFIDNTNWRLIPIGNIVIPPWEGWQFGSGYTIQSFRIDIYAEWLTGAGSNLDLDCLILIPNEHMLSIEESATTNTVVDFNFTLEDDRDVGYEYDTLNTVVSDAMAVGSTDWYMPPGNSVAVFAAEDSTHHDLTDRVTSYTDYYPRWLLYRGS